MRDYTEIAGIEFVHIGQDTDINEFKRDLELIDPMWQIKNEMTN